jgi:hypothetical protein
MIGEEVSIGYLGLEALKASFGMTLGIAIAVLSRKQLAYRYPSKTSPLNVAAMHKSISTRNKSFIPS